MSMVQTLYLRSFSLSLHSSSSMEYKKTLVVLENPVQLNCANFSTYLCKLREKLLLMYHNLQNLSIFLL